MRKRRYQYHIVYFHGLDSSLSDEKRKVMAPFGSIYAPTYDYRDANVLSAIADSFDELPEYTVFIGSSFGGYQANIYSSLFDLPCLMFNPALKFRQVGKALDKLFPKDRLSISYVVLGKQDDVIDYKDTQKFINKHFKGYKEVYFEEEMGHRVPIDIFEEHIKNFFEYVDERRNFCLW